MEPGRAAAIDSTDAQMTKHLFKACQSKPASSCLEGKLYCVQKLLDILSQNTLATEPRPYKTDEPQLDTVACPHLWIASEELPDPEKS